MSNAMSFHLGLIQLSSLFSQRLDYLFNLAITQQRRGGNQFWGKAKRRHNARINRARTQRRYGQVLDERQANSRSG
jgi:hypothetical protein